MKYIPKYDWVYRLVRPVFLWAVQLTVRDIERKEEECSKDGWYCLQIVRSAYDDEDVMEVWFHPIVDVHQFLSGDWITQSQLDATRTLIKALKDDQWLVFSDEDYSFIMGEETQ